MPYLETPALTFHYETAGRGRTLAVLLHGNLATCRWWSPLLERAPAGFTIYAPTLRGFGGTRGPGRARSVHELAEDVREFARTLGLRRFHLVGHSLGGAVALQYALTWPETLNGLELVAPASGDGLSAMRSRADFVGNLLTWTDPELPASRIMLSAAMRWGRLLGTYRPSLAHALARMMPSADPAIVHFEQLLADAIAVDDRVLLDVYEALRRWEVRARLPQLAVRVRILAGRRDTLVPLPALQSLADALPRAELDVWEDVGHTPQLERPAEFAAWLARGQSRPVALLRAGWRRVAGLFRTLLRKRPRHQLPPP